jgi:Protein of unknown function (DUF3616)
MADLKKIERVQIFCDPALEAQVRADIVKNLSGVVFSHQGKYLWMGTDEMAAIERFTRLENNPDVFGSHQRFYLKDLIDGFDEDKGEVDIEGLDYADGYLWIIGSHSSKRKKVEIESDKFTVSKKELKKIQREENRYLLARIPIDETGELDQTSPQTAWLKRDGSSNSLTKALATDEYLALGQIIDSDNRDSLPGKEFYFYLPSKENGFDIEGLAVRGNKITIGLRGPVLRSIAILLEIEVEVESSSPHELRLKNIGGNGRQYKRHFLDLKGLGIRELCLEKNGKSLLILAGPTMDLDGTHSLFRLDLPFEIEDNSLSSQKNGQLKYIGDIPHGEKKDRAEGLTLNDGGKSIFVVYDSPIKDRLISDNQDNLIGIYADVFAVD